MLMLRSRGSIRLLKVAGIALAVLSSTLQAQTPATGTAPGTRQPDSTQIAAVMANGMRMMRPAEMLLDYTVELALTPDQVSRLKTLMVTQRDSLTARQTRIQQISVQRAADIGTNALGSAMMSWSGPVDDEAIKAAMCEQSKLSSEMTLGMIHDRHAVGEVLTPEQRAKLPMLQGRDMMKGIARP